MKTLLITGVAGFIGSNVAEDILKRRKNVSVIGIDNFDANYSVALKKQNIALLSQYPNFTFYKVDIRNGKKLKEIFDAHTPDAVLHAAAKVDSRNAVHTPAAYIETNVLGTLNVLECAKYVGVRRVVFLSSSSVYGNSNKAPFSETATTDFAISPYGATKKAAEMLCYTYHHNFGLPIICLRVFNAYGRRMRPGLVLYKWVEQVLGGEVVEMSGTGTRRRDFTHVSDLSKAILSALENRSIGFDIINIGNANPVSLNELLRTLEKVTGVKVKTFSRPSARQSVEKTHANVSRAKKLLGWEPTTSLEDGVRDFVLWFKNERVKKTKQRL